MTISQKGAEWFNENPAATYRDNIPTEEYRRPTARKRNLIIAADIAGLAVSISSML